MERREVLGTLSALALAGFSASVDAAEHEHHHHHEGDSKFQPLIDAAGSCVMTGERCLAHCLVLLGDGDTSMAACSKAVNQMLAMCGALQDLAAQSSRLVPALAKVALDACSECEEACRKHAGKHAECKACGDACAECAKQCKAVI